MQRWRSKQVVRCSCVTLVALFWSAKCLFAPIQASIPIQSLVDRCDAVVAADIAQSSVTTQLLLLDLVVTKAYKGNFGTGTALSVAWSIPQGMWPAATAPNSVKIAGHGIFLLRRNGQSWTLVPPVSGFLPHPYSAFFHLVRRPAAAPSPPASLSIRDQVFDSIIDASEQGILDPISGPIDYAFELRKTTGPAFAHVTAKLASSRKANFRATANAAAVEKGDMALLARFDREQANLSDELKSQEVLDALRRGLDSRADPVVAMLGRVSTAQTADANLRVASAHALTRSGNLRALPYLASLLDSTDLRLRAAAVGGFSMIVNDIDPATNHPRAGDSAFRSEETMTHAAMGETTVAAREAYFVGYWKSWWAANRTRVPAGP